MKKIFLILTSTFVFNSCTRGFEEMNKDKDNFTEETVSVNLLLPNILYRIADTNVDNNFSLGNKVSQMISYIQYNQIDTYTWTANDSYWKLYGQIENLNDIENIGKKSHKEEYIGVAKVLKAFIFTQMSDAYGPIPMSEAGQYKQGILTPKYDSQEEVYKGANQMLKEANQILKKGATIEGDKLYGGDISKWRKFANSLRLRVLIKIMNKQDVSSEIREILSNPNEYPIFKTNQDAAIYYYSGVGNDVSPYSAGRGRVYEIEQLTALSTTMLDLAKKYNDPRIDTWYNKPQNSSHTEHKAIKPGSYSTDYRNLSMLNLNFHYNPTLIKGILMTYSELEFILAEMAEKGWVNLPAKQHYENGVKASFEFWNTAMPQNYLTETAAYTGDKLVLIAEQKWLAFFWNGFEAWNDFKRTGLPQLKPSEGNTNGNKIPSRLIYPSIEQSVNRDNYQKASNLLGGDNINSKMWWQN
ncbi:SusD/RagB family nutrient-binding outer membrane lipoprotein [Riemerella anatipestifer]|uniref:SusD/RagB family nutrient-binding outer membrane lipoprotein n=1 Tax=Riemerella anatipestifer TaxID=34085 RepID=A0A1S7DRU9_RIEAN|nr:SusD/RagB family nutrient-binding outer membrane lipoprotein [Riemerella anatipestifer]AQY21850.1 hypothetical protein AB406_0896 [Riemerella anatipestifer]MCE4248934.1 SusD/RagB family nutrient-binding outer membrane lipoprotein [Riemerella anatipestifer]MCO4303394.1 SusD/RagB family nutrient-binding outer membrane lipoprotein [Riemerella anatipestifer]MCO7352195.1 SusD/RagB family nutrient-binding outer membrane lipoprotein [Riemerella anatipestifer]MCQ4038350.1 SusD/RagB family nutrient-